MHEDARTLETQIRAIDTELAPMTEDMAPLLSQDEKGITTLVKRRNGHHEALATGWKQFLAAGAALEGTLEALKRAHGVLALPAKEKLQMNLAVDAIRRLRSDETAVEELKAAITAIEARMRTLTGLWQRQRLLRARRESIADARTRALEVYRHVRHRAAKSRLEQFFPREAKNVIVALEALR